MNFKSLINNKSIILKIIWVYLFIFISTSFSVNAGLGDGCYVSGILYTNSTGYKAKYYYPTPFNNSICGFKPNPKINGTCYIYKGSGALNKANSYYSYNNSWAADWGEIYCPLDDYVWVLLVIVVGFSINRLKLFITV